jgi:predicted anti-sigma-YlaC factor YlaD
MMHCEEAIGLMPAYLEADLGLREPAFQEHIRICSSCRRKLKELEESRSLLSHQREQAYNAPQGLIQDVLVRLERERAILSNRYFVLQVIGWAVLIMSAIYIVLCHVFVVDGDRKRHRP